ncbi:hypothetical protein SARC_04182 [Sphaeroforma arctica JP610]|uniref:Peroxin/Ferlin domain-containing protein n=1 Tax=Sphaeroforma arctica JP610 TaxID=667725 RepID=A0A0L0G3A4_9EUKA|nr:hypothetical protein SARC_04182 [Sphaeroforma arctica JP610]KNC83577.1 hypothetical protein SARC_04182 [Sphaeroforma arctica JP610]|eukprot:XP_014157479.1 hypothetical protein SARC_04182 [Sphaeroforma arctica JP610]
MAGCVRYPSFTFAKHVYTLAVLHVRGYSILPGESKSDEISFSCHGNVYQYTPSVFRIARETANSLQRLTLNPTTTTYASSATKDGTLSDDGGRVASSFAASEWLPGDRGSHTEQDMSQKTMPMRSHSSLNVRDVTKNGHGRRDTGANDEQNQRRVSGKAAEVKITVYENQRSGLFGAYSTMWLVPGMDKRGQWSLKDGTQSIALDQQKLSPGWEWTGDWTYNKNPEKYDSEGWQYAFSFWTSTWFNRPKAASYVRRRKWTRVRRMILSSYDSSKDIGSNGLSRYASQIDVASKSDRGMLARSSVKPSSSINLRSREPQAGTFAPVAPTQPSRVVVVHIDWTHCVLLMLAVLFTVVSLVAQLEMSRTWSTAVPSMSYYTIRAVHFASEWTGANSR